MATLTICMERSSGNFLVLKRKLGKPTILVMQMYGEHLTYWKLRQYCRYYLVISIRYRNDP
jgi:hypothetical protein